MSTVTTPVKCWHCKKEAMNSLNLKTQEEYTHCEHCKAFWELKLVNGKMVLSVVEDGVGKIVTTPDNPLLRRLNEK